MDTMETITTGPAINRLAGTSRLVATTTIHLLSPLVTSLSMEAGQGVLKNRATLTPKTPFTQISIASSSNIINATISTEITTISITTTAKAESRTFNRNIQNVGVKTCMTKEILGKFQPQHTIISVVIGEE